MTSTEPHLIPEDVVRIRELCADGMKIAELARMYNRHPVTIRGIVRGRTYLSAGGPITDSRVVRTSVTNEAAKEMREMRAQDAKLDDLAWLFETSLSNVHLIVTGKTHKDAGGPITAPQDLFTPEEEIIRIRHLRVNDRWTYKMLSDSFGKSEVALRSICAGKSFPNYGGPLSEKRK